MYLFVDVKNLKKIVFNDFMTYVLHEKNGERYWVREDPDGVRKPRTISWDKMVGILQKISFDTDNNNLILFKTGILHIVTSAKTWRKGEKKASKVKHAAKREERLKILKEAQKKKEAVKKKSVGDKSNNVVVDDTVKRKPSRPAKKK